MRTAGVQAKLELGTSQILAQSITKYVHTVSTNTTAKKKKKRKHTSATCGYPAGQKS
jgi:hypothetical protein